MNGVNENVQKKLVEQSQVKENSWESFEKFLIEN